MVIDELVTLLGVQLSPDAKNNITKFENAIGGIASQVKMASLVVSGFAVAATAMFKGAVDEANALNALSEKTGISTEKLQEWQYSANAMGVSAQNVTSDLVKMEQSANRTGRSLEYYADQFAGLDAKTANKKGAALGISQDTVRLLREGKDGLEKLKKEAHDLGAIIPEDNIKRAAQLKRSIGELHTVFKGIVNTVMLAAVPAVQKIVDAMSNWVKENRQFIALHLGKITEGIVTAFERVWKILTRVWEKVKELMSPFKGFFDLFAEGEMWVHVFTGALVVLMAMFAPIIAKIAAVVAIFTALSLIVEDFFTFLEGGDSLIGRAIDAILGYFTGLWDAFKTEFPALADLIESVFGFIGSLFEASFGTWGNLLSGFADVILTVLGGAFKALNTIIGGVVETVRILLKGIDAVASLFGFGGGKTPQIVQDGANLQKNSSSVTAPGGQATTRVNAPNKANQYNDNKKITVTQNITTSDPQKAGEVAANGIRNAQINNPGLSVPTAS